MELKTILREQQGSTAVIRFNRPRKLNAQNDQLVRDFLATLAAASDDSTVRVVVVMGKGRAFCSGHDLGETFDAGEPGVLSASVERLQQVTRAIRSMHQPVIAAIHGYALGVGCEWSLNCDIRIAAESARLGFPETRVGTTLTNAGTLLLPLFVGPGRAKWLTFTNEMITARQAANWGLVDKVVPDAELESAALAMAASMADNSSLALKLTKEALNRSIYRDLDTVLSAETRDARTSMQDIGRKQQ